MTAASSEYKPTWWKEGVCYQVWPLSFKDSNDDGNGDIPGLIGKLDYLKDLGVDYVWLSPMYASPRFDYGYDISDYEAVDPTFGTMEDMENLIAGLHSRGMRLMLDLVVNHTSSEHRWFKESAKSKDNEYSNYYMWRDPKIVDGKKCPPNNWRSLFGGCAWIYVPARDQYYLRLFAESMPDLNWEDETVRKAIYKSAIMFWLDKGVDGFRVDVVNLYSKNLDFPDAPIADPTDEYQPMPGKDISNGPHIHEWLQEQRREVLNKYGDDIALVGELGQAPPKDTYQHLSPATRELDMNFDFTIYQGHGMNFGKPIADWVDVHTLSDTREALKKTQGFISEHGLWATTFFENHDQPRSIPNFGSHESELHTPSGKLLALLLASMSGTLFIYQGQEIGMTGIPQDWPRSELKDPFYTLMLDEADKKYADDPVKHQQAVDNVWRLTRDNARTPVQWSSEEPYAGFSTVKPWIGMNTNFKKGINVEDQAKDEGSLFMFWKKLLQFRKAHIPILVYGHTEFVDNKNENVLSVIKHGQGKLGSGKRLLVMLNSSDKIQRLPSAEELGLDGAVGKLVFGTQAGSGEGDLQPWEGRVFEL